MNTNEYEPVPTAIRVLFGLLVTCALAFSTFGLYFFGIITYTGCFWGCTDPDPDRFGGGLILIGSAVAGAATVASFVWALVGPKPWLRSIFFGALLLLGGALAALLAMG